MSLIVKTIVRFFIFVLLQVYVLDNIQLHSMVTPYLYFLFLLWLPFSINRVLLLAIGFVLGFTIDSFHHQPGYHAAACVLVAYLRPFLINIFIPQRGANEASYEAPSATSMGGMMSYLLFAGVLAVFHHSWLYILQAWQFGDVLYFLIKILISTVISLVLIFITELLIVRKGRYVSKVV